LLMSWCQYKIFNKKCNCSASLSALFRLRDFYQRQGD
jgi:hypothetical protein